jgi:chromosome segregation ATPase
MFFIKAWVEMHFEDKVDEELLVFRRTIRNRGGSWQCDYSLNGQKIKLQEYEEKLNQLNIIVKAKNFLVFQVCFYFRHFKMSAF